MFPLSPDARMLEVGHHAGENAKGATCIDTLAGPLQVASIFSADDNRKPGFHPIVINLVLWMVD
jgi:hypothetical protein